MQLWPVALEGFRKKSKLITSSHSLSLSIYQVVGVFRGCIIAYDCVSRFYYHSNVLNGQLEETLDKHQRVKG